MASRNAKIQAQANSLFDPLDKMQSNTLKRHPKMDLSKNDLLKLLSYLEGELQARDIVIAALRAEKAKQLLYQAKYGRFGLGDPFTALQRDSDNLKDSKFDEPAIKAMYDNQLCQLENLIATQRKAQMKMREHYQGIEKRYHKAVSELDDEKRKHAQDTAQGDDVTYMLEKERERLRQEVEFEKSTNKKLEKDLKKTLASLEEQRGKSEKHKQIALLLIKERKLLGKPLKSQPGLQQANGPVGEDKGDASPMNSSTESLKSLPPHVEAMLEEKLSEFDIEKQQLTSKLGREETRNATLAAQVTALSNEVENLRRQLVSVKLGGESRGLSPGGAGGEDMIVGGVMQTSPRLLRRVGGGDVATEERGVPVGAPSHTPASLEHIGAIACSPNTHAKVSRVASSKIIIPVAGRLQPTVDPSPAPGVSSPGTVRRVLPITRGTPPPVPPNKPVISISSPRVSVLHKPLPPPKNVATNARERFINSLCESPRSIPVNVVTPGHLSPRLTRPSSPSDSTKPTKWHGVNVVSCLNPPHNDVIGVEMSSHQTSPPDHGSSYPGEGHTHAVSPSPIVHSPSADKTTPPLYKDLSPPVLFPYTSPCLINYTHSITPTKTTTESHTPMSLQDLSTKLCTVCLQLRPSFGHSQDNRSPPSAGTYAIATITPDAGNINAQLNDALTQHFNKLNAGLRTKKTMRFEGDEALLESPSLGLSVNCVLTYTAGENHWTSDSPCPLLPDPHTETTITVTLAPQAHITQFSLTTLVPVAMGEDYIRLIEQYKNVVMYGAQGTGKSHLISHLARTVVERCEEVGIELRVVSETCGRSWSHQHLKSLLLKHHCLLPTAQHSQHEHSGVILMLDEIDKLTTVTEVFGELLYYLDNRGPAQFFSLKGEDTQYCFMENFYLIATMDKNRLSSIDLSTQQRFRWVHQRVDTEPSRALVARHLLRLLHHAYHGCPPPTSHPLHRALEWLVCVWYRLNDGLAKLGLPELVFGPGVFIGCPVIKDDSKAVLSWFCGVWNGTIAPAVMDAVVYGSGGNTPGEGQKKVGNTAVYVLMQRAVVSGCPLHGAEKERYLKLFHGGNELQLSMKTTHVSSPHTAVTPTAVTPTAATPTAGPSELTSPVSLLTEAHNLSDSSSTSPVLSYGHTEPIHQKDQTSQPIKAHKSHYTPIKTDMDNSLAKIPKLDVRAILSTRKTASKNATKTRNLSAPSAHDMTINKTPTFTNHASTNSAKSPVFTPTFTTKSPKTLNTFTNFQNYISLASPKSHKYVDLSEPSAMEEIPRTIPANPTTHELDSKPYVIDMESAGHYDVNAPSTPLSNRPSSVEYDKSDKRTVSHVLSSESRHRRAKSDSSSTYFAITAYKHSVGESSTEGEFGARYLEESSC